MLVEYKGKIPKTMVSPADRPLMSDISASDMGLVIFPDGSGMLVQSVTKGKDTRVIGDSYSVSLGLDYRFRINPAIGGPMSGPQSLSKEFPELKVLEKAQDYLQKDAATTGTGHAPKLQSIHLYTQHPQNRDFHGAALLLNAAQTERVMGLLADKSRIRQVDRFTNEHRSLFPDSSYFNRGGEVENGEPAGQKYLAEPINMAGGTYAPAEMIGYLQTLAIQRAASPTPK